METTELKELMPPHVVDVQGHGINEFYTPEQVVEILRLLSVVGRSEQLVCPECKSQNVYEFTYTDGIGCNSCGHQWAN